MITEEEKEAIEEFKKQYRLSTNVDCITTDIRNEYAQTILNLIEKQVQLIDLMAEDLKTDYHSKEWIIKYYEEMIK